MALSREKPPVSINAQCRYFVHGVCSRGSSCMYQHDFSAKPANACRYYQQGHCSYGGKCRYDHVKSSRGKQQQASTATSGVKSPTRSASSSTSKCTSEQNSGSKEGRPPPPVAGLSSTSEPRQSKMTTLRKIDKRPLKSRMPASWADTPDFVPKRSSAASDEGGCNLSAASYSAAATAAGVADSLTVFMGDDGAGDAMMSSSAARHYGDDDSDHMLPMESYQYIDDVTDETASALLCPFAQMGECPFGDRCVYLHGDKCDICGWLALHPADEKQRKEHIAECSSTIEKEMDLAFAAQRTEGIACGICLEVVCEKANPADRYFGVLSECVHPFCLACIRKWRSSQHQKTVIRACPACRVPSHFVTPSRTWVVDKADKEALIGQYKSALSTKPCKYFKQGRGACPFSDSCFYRHALPDGSLAPASKPSIRHRMDADGTSRALHNSLLSEFLFHEGDGDDFLLDEILHMLM